MPTRIPSVSTFIHPNVASPADPASHPTQAVTFWLRRDIVRGVFEPMERLRVERLSQFYKIGISPVREAISASATTGLVIHEHGKGYRVAPVSLEDYDDVSDVYHRIYHLALDMALENGGQEWEERVVVQLHRSSKVQKVLLDGDPQGREMWQRAYGDLHRDILSGCGSPLLLRLHRDIGSRLERYVNLFADLESDRFRDHHAEHSAIVEALIARDADRTKSLLGRYFANAQPIRQSIVERLKKPQRAAPSKRGRPPKAIASGR